MHFSPPANLSTLLYQQYCNYQIRCRVETILKNKVVTLRFFSFSNSTFSYWAEKKNTLKILWWLICKLSHVSMTVILQTHQASNRSILEYIRGQSAFSFMAHWWRNSICRDLTQGFELNLRCQKTTLYPLDQAYTGQRNFKRNFGRILVFACILGFWWISRLKLELLLLMLKFY